GDGYHPGKFVVTRSSGGAGGDAPTGAIPVLDQRLVGAAPVGGVSHRPDVACRDGCHPGKFVVTRSTVRAGDDAPTGAIPVLDQRLVGAAPVGGVSHRPDVGCRGGRHPGKFVVTRSTVRAGDDAPARALPVL